MDVELHPHARERIEERGATQAEVVSTVQEGARFPARLGRTGFRRNFPFGTIYGIELLNANEQLLGERAEIPLKR